jgi:hypothetical protein
MHLFSSLCKDIFSASNPAVHFIFKAPCFSLCALAASARWLNLDIEIKLLPVSSWRVPALHVRIPASHTLTLAHRASLHFSFEF